MFGSKIIRNSYGSIKDKTKSCYHSCKNFPSWYMGKIFTFINYFIDVKYKVTHLKETNFNLGIDHLYKNNLNDAILRFKLVDKFFSTSDHQANYWLGWTYFLKNNYEKALYHLKKAFEADQVKLGIFLQTYNNLSDIPQQIWHQYRNLDVGGDYTKRFFGKNKVNLPYSFVSKIMSSITDLPDNYHILELGSNTGLVGGEIKKRFPDSFTLTGVENSEIMNASALHMNIYDHVLEVSIPDFIKQNSNKYDVILSFNSLSFTKNLSDYFNNIYSIVDKLGYFAFCLPINNVTNLSLKRKEFIFAITDIKEALSKTKFTILSSEELVIEKNDKYYMVVCKKNH
ncbi:methyltransferase domain-containing protein [Candidatus Tisiphia endosymbiont of Hybos culiciformis]|uniref:methyltransferase domain-containing protein n=1 Tax=Candidatus Tisiphia endosymbiont of Hybos culiciformis TaxID=3139331 RepID=UPI003CCA7736